ncbi:MAG TPA: hypothetical protein VJB70_03795 [Candidatus Paceibacterota bacterium]
MSRIPFVSKDNGGAAMVVPLAVEVRAHGHIVEAIAEGLATKHFEKADFRFYFQGTVDFQKDPFILDSLRVLRHISPEVVVVSAGSPIHLERQFAITASQLQIPLVCVEDYWGVSSKLQPTRATPQLVLSIDSYGKAIAQELYPSAAIQIVGHHEIKAITDAQNDTAGLAIFAEKTRGFDHTCVLVGGGAYTTAEIKLLVQSLKKSSGKWCLVPRFHPKTLAWSSEDGRTLEDVWKELLGPLGDRVVYVPGVKTETVVAGADVVASGFSTLMSGSAYIGKPTVCLKTKETMESLLAQSNGILNEVPVVALGCADVMESPVDLATFLGKTYLRAQEEFQPYDPKKAFTALSQFLN